MAKIDKLKRWSRWKRRDKLKLQSRLGSQPDGRTLKDSSVISAKKDDFTNLFSPTHSIAIMADKTLVNNVNTRPRKSRGVLSKSLYSLFNVARKVATLSGHGQSWKL